MFPYATQTHIDIRNIRNLRNIRNIRNIRIKRLKRLIRMTCADMHVSSERLGTSNSAYQTAAQLLAHKAHVCE